MSSSSCNESDWWLNGTQIHKNLQSLNGDIYYFNFISNNGSGFTLALWSFRLFGIILIFFAYRNLLLRLENQRMQAEAEINYANSLISITQTVAHDIRSPLSALNSLVWEVSGLSQDQKNIIRSVISRINGIAEDLLRQRLLTKKQHTIQSKYQQSECELLAVLESLIKEKELEFREHIPSIKIELRKACINTHINLSSIDITRIISNIINNAIEATIHEGTIFVEINDKEHFIFVTITDQGKGIPEDILESLKVEPKSYGKENSKSGNGIGLYSAYTTLRSMGGDLDILSKVNVGTRVTLTLPKANAKH